MARKANENPNSPTDNDVKKAVSDIEGVYADLRSEQGTYMNKCRGHRQRMAVMFETATDKGISKKLLRKVIKERDLERRIDTIGSDLEQDERSEFDMLREKLGMFADTPLGQAALAANGASAQAGA